MVGFNLPEEINNCPFALGDTGVLLLNGVIRMKFRGQHNNNFGPQGGGFELWSKNTALADGTPREPFIDDSDALLQVDIQWINNGQNPDYILETPVTYRIGRRPQTGKFETESLYVYYTSNVAYPNSPARNGWGSFDGRGVFVGSVLRADTVPGSIEGYSVVPAGVASTWYLLAEIDTTAYDYQWYLNGVLQAADTGARFSRTFSTAGSYTLRVDQGLIDTSYTISKVVTVPVTVGWDTPAWVAPYSTHTFTASASAGTAPYTYSWKVDGVPVGAAASLQWTFITPATLHDVSLVVTDANGNIGAIQEWVSVTAGCDPQNPECHDQLRAAPKRQSGSKPIPVKRLPVKRP